MLACNMGERAQRGLEFVDPTQGSRDKLARRQLPGANKPGELERRAEKQIVYHFFEGYKVVRRGGRLRLLVKEFAVPKLLWLDPQPPQET
jgi:hypothetical protein